MCTAIRQIKMLATTEYMTGRTRHKYLFFAHRLLFIRLLTVDFISADMDEA
jgi:hypothetical protein